MTKQPTAAQAAKVLARNLHAKFQDLGVEASYLQVLEAVSRAAGVQAFGALKASQAAKSLSLPGAVDFDAVRDQRMCDLTPAQQDDARELWLRDNLAYMPDYHRDFYVFLLGRLDAARGGAPKEAAPAAPSASQAHAPSTSPLYVMVAGKRVPVMPLQSRGAYRWESYLDVLRDAGQVDWIIPVRTDVRELESYDCDIQCARQYYASSLLTGDAEALDAPVLTEVQANVYPGRSDICAMRVRGQADKDWLAKLRRHAVASDSEDDLAQAYVLTSFKPGNFLALGTRGDSLYSPEAFMASAGLKRDEDGSWAKSFPTDPAKMTWEQAVDWINAAMLAAQASDQYRNWGSLSMTDDIEAFERWYRAYLEYIKPRLEAATASHGQSAICVQSPASVAFFRLDRRESPWLGGRRVARGPSS